jgi:diguanylate cyclase (GGDEF)-like protein
MIAPGLVDPRDRGRHIILAIIAVPLLGYVDIITGYELSFSAFYLVPITVAAWAGGTIPGLALSLACAMTWGVADALSGHHYSHDIYYVWNSLIRLALFTVVTLLLVDKRRTLQSERALARTDSLTGLANSRLFTEVVEHELRRCRRYHYPLSIAFIDLDNFKQVNDSMGHAAGDSLLQRMATGLRSHLRETDTAARLGGDEFAVLLPEADVEAAAAAARKMHQGVADAAKQSGFSVSASIGVVTCRQPPGSADELIRLADEVMYSVKRRSKNTVACSVHGTA